jgi:hypothetical protein
VGTITLPKTITDDIWFDASFIMNNFNAIRNAVNQGLDQNNLLASSEPDINSLMLTEDLDCELIELTGSLEIDVNENFSFAIQDSTEMDIFSLHEDGDIAHSERFDLLPIGTIAMFSGTWVDNDTILGWFQCDGTDGTPDLVDKFIRGGTASGATGGSDDAVVVEHTHTVSCGGQSADHTHVYSGTSGSQSLENHTHDTALGFGGAGYHLRNYDDVLEDYTTYTEKPASDGDKHRHAFSFSTGNASAGHTHTVVITDEGTAPGNESNLPAYYTLIFIMRIS